MGGANDELPIVQVNQPQPQEPHTLDFGCDSKVFPVPAGVVWTNVHTVDAIGPAALRNVQDALNDTLEQKLVLMTGRSFGDTESLGLIQSLPVHTVIFYAFVVHDWAEDSKVVLDDNVKVIDLYVDPSIPPAEAHAIVAQVRQRSPNLDWANDEEFEDD